MGYKDPEKQKEYQRNWLAKRRADWFSENGPCINCGSWDNLELDHIDPSTKVDNKIWSWSKERRDKETAKCQVLCEDCHHEKTIANKEYLYGEDIGNAVLKNHEVLWARKQNLNGMKFVDMEPILNVKADTIRVAVRSGWTHLEIGPIPYNGK